MRTGRTLTGLVTVFACGALAHASTVDFRLAGTTPAEGWKAFSAGGETFHVSPSVALSGTAVRSADIVASRSGTDLELDVGPDAVRALSTAMKRTRADRLAAVAGGRTIRTGVPELDSESGRITITGLAPSTARYLSRALTPASLRPVEPTIFLVATAKSVTPGGTVEVDVFASGVAGLHVYQVALEVDGGPRGGLAVSDLWVDADRPDYVFAGRQKIEAADRVGGRLGATLFDDSMNVSRGAYLGTFELHASRDAAGEFTVDARSADHASFIKDAGNHDIEFDVDASVTLTVETVERSRRSGK